MKGSLPNYIKALTSDSALSNGSAPSARTRWDFPRHADHLRCVHYSCPRADGPHPAVGSNHHGYSYRTFAGILFTTGVFASSTLDGLDFVYDGSQVFPLIVVGIYLAIFLGIDTILGWSFKHAIHQLASLPPMIAKVLTRTHGLRTLYLRERRPLEARQRTSASRAPGRFWASWDYSPCSWSSQPPWNAQRACWGAPEVTTSHALAITTT